MVDSDYKHSYNVSYEKVKYHVVKRLGKRTNSDSKELSLLFEPRHRSIYERIIDDDSDHIRSQKKNQHVACGEKKISVTH